MRHMIVSALRGESCDAGSPEITERERLVGDLLNRVWFALMMSWAGGVQSQGTIGDQMRASVELLLGPGARGTAAPSGAAPGAA